MEAPFKQLTPDQAVWLALETACEAFETLQALLEREIGFIRLTPDKSEDRTYDHLLVRAFPAALRALVESFIFNTRRANRLCEKHAGVLSLDRDERRRFMRAADAVTIVRDVREHLLDGNGGRVTTMHDQGTSRGDELSLTFDGPGRILAGPINLCAIYPAVNRARKLLRPKTPL